MKDVAAKHEEAMAKKPMMIIQTHSVVDNTLSIRAYLSPPDSAFPLSVAQQEEAARLYPQPLEIGGVSFWVKKVETMPTAGVINAQRKFVGEP